MIGYGSHFEGYVKNGVDLHELEQAVYLSDEDAAAAFTAFAQKLSESASVRAYHGSYGFYMELQLSGKHFCLHQLRPRTDYWHNLGPDRNQHGSLKKMLQAIHREILPGAALGGLE